ncbi:MAG TPA: type II toxin-antitoxin system VapC family toxin [Mycobacteriales bacterium]|nr:type II toxin-antitoxin system VapC family toxin [Mycobacteriales bacterium]
MTALLLDTHVALWLLAGINISPAVQAVVEDSANDVYLREVAIKQSSGKLEGLPEDYLDLLVGQGVELLAVHARHVRAVRHLPLHHRDPFDRMIVALTA